jgi:hypothetical protein
MMKIVRDEFIKDDAFSKLNEPCEYRCLLVSIYYIFELMSKGIKTWMFEKTETVTSSMDISYEEISTEKFQSLSQLYQTILHITTLVL